MSLDYATFFYYKILKGACKIENEFQRLIDTIVNFGAGQFRDGYILAVPSESLKEKTFKQLSDVLEEIIMIQNLIKERKGD